MSRPGTAPSRSRLERAQSSPVRREGARRREEEEGNRIEPEEASIEAAVVTLRRSAEIEDLQSGEDIEELTSVRDEERGKNSTLIQFSTLSFLKESRDVKSPPPPPRNHSMSGFSPRGGWDGEGGRGSERDKSVFK